MIKTKRVMLLAFVIMISMMSCNSEELFVELVEEAEIVQEEVDEEVDEEVVDSEDEETEPDPSLPCDFDLNSIEPNSTIIINCIMDLQGQTINLPANVTIVYEGGDIINGTLNFSDNGIISGELLNSTVAIGGSTPQLNATTFNFDPQRWDIVEGVVSDEIAIQNRDFLEGYFVQIKHMGASVFNIDKMDAYFKTDDASQHVALAALNIPSDFTLKMTDNTHIRVQPNNYKNTTLLALYEVSNVTIDGGNLHGDRDEHDYSLGGTQEWGHCLRITSGTNVIVKNVTIMDAGGDAIDINASKHAWADNYVPSSNILITNNTLLRSRRNNISITDGRDVLIENNQIIDAGIDTALSSGALPGWGIDIEAVRNSGQIWEIAEDIIIRNNVETGSKYGAFLIFAGDKIIIESNTTENRIGYTNTTQSIIRNNTITANPSDINQSSFGISASTQRDFSSGYENVISGNTITGFGLGMSISDAGLEIFDNNIIECKEGVRFAKTRNCNFYRNTIKSTVATSNGVINHVLEFIDNLVIGADLSEDGNIIDVVSNPIKLYKINEEVQNADYKIIVKNNSILGGNNLILFNINNVDVLDNDINAGIWLNTASNINISNNNIDGFRLDSSLENISVTDNILKTCLSIPSDAVNFTESNNLCD